MSNCSRRSSNSWNCIFILVIIIWAEWSSLHSNVTRGRLVNPAMAKIWLSGMITHLYPLVVVQWYKTVNRCHVLFNCPLVSHNYVCAYHQFVILVIPLPIPIKNLLNYFSNSDILGYLASVTGWSYLMWTNMMNSSSRAQQKKFLQIYWMDMFDRIGKEMRTFFGENGLELEMIW